VIACLLDKQPGKRYVSANAVLHDFARRSTQDYGAPAHSVVTKRSVTWRLQPEMP
jgi:hypothetical protein